MKKAIQAIAIYSWDMNVLRLVRKIKPYGQAKCLPFKLEATTYMHGVPTRIRRGGRSLTKEEIRMIANKLWRKYNIVEHVYLQKGEGYEYPRK